MGWRIRTYTSGSGDRVAAITINPCVDEAGVEPAQAVLQTAALPLELSVHKIAETEWFEHSTLCLTSNCSAIELCFHNRGINRKETIHSALTWLSYPKNLGEGFEPSTACVPKYLFSTTAVCWSGETRTPNPRIKRAVHLTIELRTNFFLMA